jgi:hypothetical protein
VSSPISRSRASRSGGNLTWTKPFSEQGRYFVVDEETRNLLKEVSLEPGQRIALIPIARGG